MQRKFFSMIDWLADHKKELSVIDASVSIDVSLFDDLFHFVFGQRFAQIGHHVFQFAGGDQPITILESYI